MMTIDRLDHLVLTVADLQATCKFYTQILGMQVITFADNRTALQFGQQKINLHETGKEIAPHALNPTPGSADLCFVTTVPLQEAIAHIRACGIELETDIVTRTGAMGAIASIYLCDPDGNLLEISNYL